MSTIANILGWTLVSAFAFIVFILTVVAACEGWYEIQRQRNQRPPHHPPETDVRDLA